MLHRIARRKLKDSVRALISIESLRKNVDIAMELKRAGESDSCQFALETENEAANAKPNLKRKISVDRIEFYKVEGRFSK
jgi:hypothetical protein